MVRIGVHCPVDKSLSSVIDWTKQIQANTTQYFFQNPRTTIPRKVSNTEWIAFNQQLQTERITPVFIHAPYVVNMCSTNEKIREKSQQVIQHLLVQIDSSENTYLVTHIGYHGGEGFEAGLNRFYKGIGIIQESVSLQKLIIENAAGQTNAMGVSFEELDRLLEPFPEMGICIDTAHLWGFGLPPGDRQVRKKMTQWQTDSRLKLIHLNNAKDELGSKKDHHAKLNDGKIPEHVMKSFAKDFQNIPFILETPKNTLEEDAEQIRIIKRWIGITSW